MNSVEHSEPITLADLISRIEEDQRLDPTQRRDRISAIQRLCRFSNVSASVVPASVPEVRQLVQEINPALCGIKPRSLQNMVSLLRDIFHRYRAGSTNDKPDPGAASAWAALKEVAPDQKRLIVLHRFMHFSSCNGWGPYDIDCQKLTIFIEALKTEELMNIDIHVRNVVAAWNRAVKTVPGWPPQRLQLADPNRRFTVNYEALPASLREDLEKYLSYRRVEKLTAEHLTGKQNKPIKESSAKAFRYQILALASALVRQGIPIEALKELKDIVRPDRAVFAIKFFIDRHHGEKRTAQTHQLASTMLSIGKLWSELPDPELNGCATLHRIVHCFRSA